MREWRVCVVSFWKFVSVVLAEKRSMERLLRIGQGKKMPGRLGRAMILGTISPLEAWRGPWGGDLRCCLVEMEVWGGRPRR